MRVFGLRAKGHIGVYPSVRIWNPQKVSLGSYVAIDDAVNLYSVDQITIGSKVAVSRGVFICTASHDVAYRNLPLITAPVEIKDGVWIGAFATILPGVTIGEGAVVAACSVVTKDVPPFSVVAGCPARVIKERKVAE